MNSENVLTLLIADDEASIRNGLCRAIDWQSQHVRVIAEAKTGTEAYEKILELHPDIVITDIKMPGCTGLEMIEKAREQGEQAQFIILSGYDDFTFAQRAIHSQVSSYLLKPVKTAELLAQVAQVRTEILARRTSGEQREREQFAAQRGNRALTERFYSMIAAGEYHTEAEINAAVESLAVSPLPCPCVAVVLRFTLPKTADSAHFSAEDTRLFKTALRNVVTELAGDTPHVYYLDHASDVGVLLHAREDLGVFLQRCIETMKQICSLELTAGIGKKADTLLAVGDSCRAAAEMVEYHLYESGTNVFDFALVSQTQDGVPPQPPAMQRLAEAIVTQDTAMIAQELSLFFEAVFYVPMPPPRYVRGMCAYIMNDVAKRVAALLQYDSAFSFALWTQEIETLATFRQIRDAMLRAFINAAQQLQKCKKIHMPAAVEQAQEYIRSNVFSRLRVDTIAAKVHLSESHFTTLFKKSVGITVRDYILNCKLETAKELLRQKNKTIFEISELLEYEDYRSFSRAFKRYAGCSPTEYQNGIVNRQGEAAL